MLVTNISFCVDICSAKLKFNSIYQMIILGILEFSQEVSKQTS